MLTQKLSPAGRRQKNINLVRLKNTYEAIIGQVGPKMAKDSQEWPRMAKDGPRTENIKTDTFAKIRCCFLLVIRVVCYSHY